MMRFPYLITFFLLCLISQRSFSQAALQADTASQQTPFNKAVTYFNTAIGAQARLYNGPEFHFYDPLIIGSAFFEEAKTTSSGSVYYDGYFYTDVPLMYDLVSDNVATVIYDKYAMFSLLKERVAGFNLLDHHFININADTITNNKAGLKSGYYDELYKGKVTVLVKRIKGIQDLPSTVDRQFYNHIIFYLQKNGNYYEISNEGDMLDILKDKRKDLRQYVKSNKIKFKKDQDAAMVKIAAYYDHLTN